MTDTPNPAPANDACAGAARARPAGRRRARLLSGRRLSGAVPPRFRAGMGCRHFDRRHQRRDHRRQSAREAGRAAQGILGDGFVAGALESRHQGRPRALAVQRDQRRADRHLRRARLLHAALSAGAAVAAGQPAIAELLRHRAAAQDAGAAGRFRPHQRLQDPAQRRRGRRDHRAISNISTISRFKKLGKKIGPEHIMASGALPPGFPSVEIEGEHYWDGGIASNTPLDYVLDERSRPRSPDLPGRPVQRARRSCRCRCSRPPSAKRTSAFPAAPA